LIDLIRWFAPSDGWVKLNADGASRGNLGPAGGGGVIEGPLSNWVHGFLVCLGICSSVKAALLRLFPELRVAWKKGVDKLLVHMDFEVAINKIKTLVNHISFY